MDQKFERDSQIKQNPLSDVGFTYLVFYDQLLTIVLVVFVFKDYLVGRSSSD